VAACKQTIQAESTGSASQKAQLEALCEKAYSNNPAQVHEAAQELCIALITSLGLTGASRERALVECKTAQ
jgi:hypothetical protein